MSYDISPYPSRIAAHYVMISLLKFPTSISSYVTKLKNSLKKMCA